MKKQYYIYYGILQSFHILFLIILLSNTNWVFGFLNNYSEWNIQFINMFKAISIIDLFNAIASVFMVYKYVNNIKMKKLEIIVLSISVYSALIFGLAINFNKLQEGNELLLILFSIPFLPVFYFWYLSFRNISFND